MLCELAQVEFVALLSASLVRDAVKLIYFLVDIADIIQGRKCDPGDLLQSPDVGGIP